jgi:hypothetical protein
MTSLVDIWRAVDPDAGLVSGSPERLGQPVRGVARTRVAAPHLPDAADGSLLVADAGVATPLETLFGALSAAELRPVGVLLAAASATGVDRSGDLTPVLASTRSAADLADAAQRYLADESGWLAAAAAELRLLCAEATLAEPEVGTPAGLVAARIRRGVAVSVDGDLRALHERRAGRAVAARFAAIHGRLLAGNVGDRPERRRQTRDGLWLLERRIRPGASVWLFDDLAFAAFDEVAADAVASTLRALLRRPAPRSSAREARPGPPAPVPSPAAGTDVVNATLLAVARANGRVSRAARELGVHRNTVLYRLRRAADERGIDPRRPADALRLLADAEGRPGHEGVGTRRAHPPQ